MSVPIRHSISPLAVAVVGLAIVVVIVLLGLIYGESHYRNCLLKADAEHPPTSDYVLKQANPLGIPGQGQGPANSNFVPKNATARSTAINNCSRLPF